MLSARVSCAVAFRSMLHQQRRWAADFRATVQTLSAALQCALVLRDLSSQFDKALFQKNPTTKLLLQHRPLPINGFVFPRNSVIDSIFNIAQQGNFQKMYLGYSGQGKTTAMKMAMEQVREINGQKFCIRAVHASFRSTPTLTDPQRFVSIISEAIGGSVGDDRPDLAVATRLEQRVKQLTDAFYHVRGEYTVSLSMTQAQQELQKLANAQAIVDVKDVSVRVLPILWIDDLHCCSNELSIALVQSLLEFPFPVIFTVSEHSGYTKIREGSGIPGRLPQMYEFPTMSDQELADALTAKAITIDIQLSADSASLLSMLDWNFPKIEAINQVASPTCKSDTTAKALVDLFGDDMTSFGAVLGKTHTDDSSLLKSAQEYVASQSAIKNVFAHSNSGLSLEARAAATIIFPALLAHGSWMAVSELKKLDAFNSSAFARNPSLFLDGIDELDAHNLIRRHANDKDMLNWKRPNYKCQFELCKDLYKVKEVMTNIHKDLAAKVDAALSWQRADLLKFQTEQVAAEASLSKVTNQKAVDQATADALIAEAIAKKLKADMEIRRLKRLLESDQAGEPDVEKKREL